MTLDAFSRDNMANSLAVYLAEALLSAGYLVYWHAADAVQTPVGWYPQYRATQDVYEADATFAAQLSAARGLVTLRDADAMSAANPLYPVRPTDDGDMPSAQDVAVPSLTVELSDIGTGRALELGSSLRERWRYVALWGFARDATEMRWFTDHLAMWCDEDVVSDVADHTQDPPTVLGTVSWRGVELESAIVPIGLEATQFEFMLNARLVFDA